MRCAATDPQHDARVLNAARRVEQLRTNRSHLRPQGLYGKGFEPIGRRRLDVVVEEADQLATGLRHRGIVDRGEIESARHVHRTSEFGIEGCKVSQRLGVIAAIVDDKGFDPCRIVRSLQSLETGAQEVDPVAGRHDRGDRRKTGALFR